MKWEVKKLEKGAEDLRIPIEDQDRVLHQTNLTRKKATKENSIESTGESTLLQDTEVVLDRAIEVLDPRETVPLTKMAFSSQICQDH